MASQPMPVQAFYPQALATPGLPPQGMVANPAFYGSPAVAGAQQPAAGGAPYAMWPGGQAVVYSGTPAAAFYQPAVYPVPVPGAEGAPAPLALPTGPAGASPAAATAATDASAAAAANSHAAAAAAGKPADAAHVVAPGQLAASPALMAPGIAGHQPILAGQPQPILPPEYWAQATALTAQAQGAHVHQPGTALMQQNLTAVANAVAVASGQPAEMYPLDEREIKRQRRKQSNRESARRSRLRKQAECEDLNKKVDELADENVTQKSQLEQMKALCEKYEAQNSSLQARLGPRASNGESNDVGKFQSTTAPLTPDVSSAGG